MSLSNLGISLQKEIEFMKPIYKVFFSPYDREKNPDGYINLGVAQSELIKPTLAKCIKKLREAAPFSEQTFGYADFTGSQKLKESLKWFFAKYLFLCDESQLEKNNFIVYGGCNVLLETMGSLICNQNEYLILDSPYYHALDMDFARRFNVLLERVPLILETNEKSVLSYKLDFQALRERLIKNPKIKGILLVNPHNPTGKLYSDQELKGLLDICLEFNIHIISDEVYALSSIKSDKIFKSLYHFVLHEEDSEKREQLEKLVHIIYSCSKDWGLNGFRIGLFYSKNAEIIKALSAISDVNAVSRDTVFLIENLFSDKEMIDYFISQNQKILQEAYNHTIKILNEYSENLEYVDPDAGMFIYFHIKTELSQEKIFEIIMDEAHVALTQGKYCQDQRQRWYRLCFAGMKNIEELDFALRRMCSTIKNANNTKF